MDWRSIFVFFSDSSKKRGFPFEASDDGFLFCFYLVEFVSRK